ncbi:putative sulfurtransferase DndC [gamma proteobacterium NOR5-3]|nr:putative sulfurtransferase DndC [gamma proteobacterium NOR5-3]
MSESPKKQRKTAFRELGIKQHVENLEEQTRQLYLSDEIPWVIGYSGGKDSTATLQLIWSALSKLSPKDHIKPVHVISTDTLVENPVVALWVEKSLSKMRAASGEQSMPIKPHRLTPEVKDRFWVNLIGRGYPAPRPKFRWCTERLKISPSNKFISETVQQNGEAILVLGTRKSESAARASNMKQYESKSTRDLLSSNKELDRVWVYTPIAEWQNDDVWQYLTQFENPWGFPNEDLFGMYQGATEDGECPLVVDTSTPSCGDSRFGCHVCTMVNEDKSLSAMIQNDVEKEWMLPLLEFRSNWININDADPEKKKQKIDEERKHRDFRRMNGSLTVFNGRLVHGPYKAYYRENMLRAVLEAQMAVREIGPDSVKDLEVISLEELEEIRRIWVVEKHEIEDRLPVVYEEATGQKYPARRNMSDLGLSQEDLTLLKEICQEVDDSEIHYEVVRALLHIEHQNRTMVKRNKGFFKNLEKVLESGVFSNEADAQDYAVSKQSKKDDIIASASDEFSQSDYIQLKEIS